MTFFIASDRQQVPCVISWPSQQQAGPTRGVTAVPQFDGSVEVLSREHGLLRGRSTSDLLAAVSALFAGLQELSESIAFEHLSAAVSLLYSGSLLPCRGCLT